MKRVPEHHRSRRAFSSPLLLLSTAALLFSATASSQTAGGPPAGASSSLAPDARLTLAKDLFRQGVALLNTGDFEGALDFFLRSRVFVPSSSNTRNAAFCLERLERYDEALEMYEELLRSFGGDLSPTEQAFLSHGLHALAEKVGSLQITANTDGEVFVDDRDRGRLPLIGPIRVRGLRHRVRVSKDGYAPFDTIVDVAPGSLSAIRAELRLLTGVGMLRVEDSGGTGEHGAAPIGHVEATDVFLDGRRVGAVPWEGPVEPGRHLVWTRRQRQGSAPMAVVVVEGQTALARMASSALGPKVEIEVSPATAEISLDGTPLGNRSWEGRLPVGMHHVSVAEAGYRTESQTLMVPPSRSAEDEAAVMTRGPRSMGTELISLGSEGGSAKASASPEPLKSIHLRFALVLDPGHARWNRRAASPVFPRSSSFLGAFGGYLGSTNLHNGEILGCPGACGAHPPAHGFIVGLRSGYRFSVGLAPEFAGGYMAFGSDLTAMSGLFIGAGMSYRAALSSFLGITLRTTVGILSAETETGTILALTQPFFVMPEIGAEAAFGRLHVGVQLGLGFFPSGGTALPPETMMDVQARPYDAFLLWAPQLGAVYAFN